MVFQMIIFAEKYVWLIYNTHYFRPIQNEWYKDTILAMFYLYFKYKKILHSIPFLCSAMDFFVFNPFQITLSFTPISYFGHSGHKRSFTALFNTKSTVYSVTIYVYICAAFMPNIRAKSYLMFLLFASQTVLENSK